MASGETKTRTQKIKQIAVPVVTASVILGLATAFFQKKPLMTYVSNSIGFGIFGLMTGVIAANIIINKEQI